MKLVLLDSSSEPAFWDHVLQDVPDYYFFILDWKVSKDKTKIFLAVQDERIVGLMLIYDHVIQIRGSSEAAELLMNEANLEKAEINAFKEHEAFVLRKYKPIAKHEMILMTLHRGEERLYIKHPITRLTIADAQGIADLLNEALPEFGEFIRDPIIEKLKSENALFLGIKENGKLVSLGITRMFDFGTNIGTVATRKGYMGRGYATSIVSALLKEILRASKLALIHVLSDNPSAVHVYTKVGYKPYKTYLFMRGEKIA